jgi:hypothetical protein
MTDRHGIHMAKQDVTRLVRRLADAEGDERSDLIARLAWRPAWAIRSRRGAIRALAKPQTANEAGAKLDNLPPKGLR